MGKGKGKASKRAEKSAKKSAKKAAKRATREAAGIAPKPRPDRDSAPRPMKKKKIQRPLLSSDINLDDLPELPTPAAKATEALKHVKWTALFKKHIGILEAHVKALDRVMQSLKAFMSNLDQEEREMWECGEKGNWKNICGLMDRAREAVVSARIAATGMLPPEHLRDKKGLGIKGFTFEPLMPKIEQRAKELGRDPKTKYTMPNDAGNTGYNDDSDSDSSSSEESDAENDDGEESSDDEKRPASKEDAEENGTGEGGSAEIEGNPYFVIDINPTPVHLNGDAVEPKKKNKKRANDGEVSAKKAKKSKGEQAIVPGTTSPAPESEALTLETATLKNELPTNGDDTKAEKKSKKNRAKDEDNQDKKSKKSKKDKLTNGASELAASAVDFTAIQAKLQEEVDESMKAKEAEAQIAGAAEKKDKKRRRNSDGEENVGKKAKKDTEDRKEKKTKKRKVDEEGVEAEVEVKEKKKKKRQA